MALPFFYKEDLFVTDTDVVLDETSSKHIVQVLRMQNNEQLLLTDGKGNLFKTTIIDNNRKRCIVHILERIKNKRKNKNVTIVISPIKNNSRFEWFLEKATEIGITEIIPLICERTEKVSFKYERSKNILISAMLQSQQSFLPVLQQPKSFNHLLTQPLNNYNKYIAHCQDESDKHSLAHQTVNSLTNHIILIGPEGDFTNQEISLALQNNFVPVSLGNTRLRTETAGIVAAALLCHC